VANLAGGLVTVALAGGLAGALAGTIPGVHPNTLAAIGLVLHAQGTVPGPPTAALLVAALGAWTFASAIPLVVLGVPEGESAPALLPGQRMAHDGNARQALAASAKGSLVGLVLGAPIAFGVALALELPGSVDALQTATPIVAMLAVTVLVVLDRAPLPNALLVATLAGTVGYLALDQPVRSPMGWPATPLMPLFVGLYGLPALTRAARSEPIDDPVPTTRPDRPSKPGALGPTLGSLLGTLAGSFAGFTAGPATAIAASIQRQRPAGTLATMSSVNTASVCVASAMLRGAGRTRTGVHAAQKALVPGGGTLAHLATDLAHVALGGAVGVAMLALLARHADDLPDVMRKASGLLVVPWIAGILLFTGWLGALVCAAAWATARLGAIADTRRSLLMTALLVPAGLQSLAL